MTAVRLDRPSGVRRATASRHLLLMPAANPAWATAQGPFRALWRKRPASGIALAATQRTAGDMLATGSTLGPILRLARRRTRALSPRRHLA